MRPPENKTHSVSREEARRSCSAQGWQVAGTVWRDLHAQVDAIKKMLPLLKHRSLERLGGSVG